MHQQSTQTQKHSKTAAGEKTRKKKQGKLINHHLPVRPQKCHDHELRVCKNDVSLGIELQN